MMRESGNRERLYAREMSCWTNQGPKLSFEILCGEEGSVRADRTGSCVYSGSRAPDHGEKAKYV